MEHRGGPALGANLIRFVLVSWVTIVAAQEPKSTRPPKLDVSDICDKAPTKKPEWSNPVTCLVESTRMAHTLCQFMSKLELERARSSKPS